MTTPQITPKLSIPALLSRITEFYSPRLVATVNREYDIKIAKIRGPFIWHSHPDSDELFYILGGTLTIQIERSVRETEGEGKGGDGSEVQVEDVVLVKGDVFVVPRGVRHRPVTGVEEGDGAEVMMIERVGTVNTGDEEGSREGGWLTKVPVDVRVG